ncbi:hypothetical protein CJ760_07540 [Listeria monocytogenes]|uniref:hypothetical protein n=1 Tax=Listeria monocytogenes TaxID=1639 RepID=UPI000573BCBE|nr:hypothetical protein [Listeria monocytogenes]EAF3077108.1 hypothetical protein [Listeria monocytogenes serotype 1/2a]EKE4574388.1 hypothetical protein [Listeria monocytogenes serotype 1/2b]AXB13298.1 hypothetical protein RK57_12030 [Listeria monocytogenes]EAA0152060.1 hypothetical protein [Listeria monocytogenes]EAA0276044.1 hypothetical protein [Listeria monocytogenes]
MKELRLFLDYKCYPVWVYNDAGILKENDLPDELKQDEYDKLFIDTEIEFRYEACKDEKEKEEFFHEFIEVQKHLKETLGKEYNIVNKILV